MSNIFSNIIILAREETFQSENLSKYFKIYKAYISKDGSPKKAFWKIHEIRKCLFFKLGACLDNYKLKNI